MNFKTLLFTLVILTLIFSLETCGLFQCHKCLQNGENFNLPYQDAQVLTYTSDKGNSISFIADVTKHESPGSYCGELGSGTYQYCNGGSSATLIGPDSLFATLTCDQPTYSFGEMVSRKATVLGYSVIDDRKVSGSTVSINGKSYKNLKFYDKRGIHIGECSSFYWSIDIGIVQFTVVTSTGTEIWSL